MLVLRDDVCFARVLALVYALQSFNHMAYIGISSQWYSKLMFIQIKLSTYGTTS